MLEGNIGTKISFREKQEFTTLTMHCNSLSDYLQDTFSTLNAKLEEIEKSTSDSAAREQVASVRKSLPGQTT